MEGNEEFVELEGNFNTIIYNGFVYWKQIGDESGEKKRMKKGVKDRVGVEVLK